jgi:hypothetical protein
MPVWWWVARVAVPLVCVFSVVGVFLLSHPDFEETRDLIKILSKTKAFLLAAPIVVLLAPCRDTDLIASSRVAIIMPQIKTFAWCLFVGAHVFAVNFCMAFARVVGWEAYVLYAVAMGGVCLLPIFHRLPFWRVVVAALLLMSALVPYHLANFY